MRLLKCLIYTSKEWSLMKNKWTDKVQRDDFDRMVIRGLTAVGAHLQSEAQSNCPVVTGRLIGSITWATSKDKSSPSSPAGAGDAVSQPADKYTCHVGTNVEYAAHVEYNEARGQRQSLKTRRIYKATKGSAFLRPALDENQKQVREIFKKYIKEMVRGK